MPVEQLTREQLEQKLALVYKQGFSDGSKWLQERVTKSMEIVR